MELKINEPWITSKVRCQNGYAYIDKPFWNVEKQMDENAFLSTPMVNA